MPIKKRRLILTVWLCIITCLSLKGAPVDSEDRIANLRLEVSYRITNRGQEVEGVPREFLETVYLYMIIGEDDGPPPQTKQGKLDRKALDLSRDRAFHAEMRVYEDRDSYLLKIIDSSENFYLRWFSLGTLNDVVSDREIIRNYSRDYLRKLEWESHDCTDATTERHIGFILEQPSNDDLKLWDDLWERMDEKERALYVKVKPQLAKKLSLRIDRLRDGSSVRKSLDPNGDHRGIKESKEIKSDVFNWLYVGAFFVVVSLLGLSSITLRKIKR